MRRRMDTHVPKLNLPNLSQGVDNLSSNLVGHIELDHTHVRRAKHGVLCGRHTGVSRCIRYSGIRGGKRSNMRAVGSVLEKLQLVVMASAACSCPSTATGRGWGMTKHDVALVLAAPQTSLLRNRYHGIYDQIESSTLKCRHRSIVLLNSNAIASP